MCMVGACVVGFLTFVIIELGPLTTVLVILGGGAISGAMLWCTEVLMEWSMRRDEWREHRVGRPDEPLTHFSADKNPRAGLQCPWMNKVTDSHENWRDREKMGPSSHRYCEECVDRIYWEMTT